MAGNSARGNPKIIALRSIANTDCTVRLPFRNRNPSTTADQLTAGASCAGGDGRIATAVAITTRNVTASNTKAPAGSIVTSNRPATTGPTIDASVWNPASSAFEEG